MELIFILAMDKPIDSYDLDLELTLQEPLRNLSGMSLRPKSILSTGTRYVLRYVGDSKSLSETLTYVKLERLRNRVVFGVKCPFCEKRMDQSSLSGKRREVREERYKCESGHRVSLLPKKDGSMGWK